MDNKFDGISCLFLDLDGTLLGVSDEAFEKHYIRYVTARFTDLIEPKKFINALWEGTEAMIKHNDPERYVLESFFDTFKQLTGIDRETTFKRFDDFYRTEYARLKEVCDPIDAGKKLVEVSKTKGYKIVCATNPVFPEIATRQRLSWTDLAPTDFLHVTHAENSNYCKPNPQYFNHLLDIAQVEPEEVLMVGNDYFFDMSASQLGIRTWLTESYIGGLEHKDTFKVDYQGTLEMLIERL